MTDGTPPPTQDDLAAARRRVANALHEMHFNQQIWISPELARELDTAWSAYDTAVLATRPMVTAEPLICGWCEYEASYSVNWECGHASAMCVLCFEPSDARDWTMDLMDWGQVPAICPDCAG